MFELGGPDRAGLLAEVTHLLTHNGCNVRSAAVRALPAAAAAEGLPLEDRRLGACACMHAAVAARRPALTHALVHTLLHTAAAQVWTYRGRVAFVLSITEKGLPVVDGIKLQRLRQLVLGALPAGVRARRAGPGRLRLPRARRPPSP